jgi:tetratricopeptide (TPR) repeat protein
MDLITQSILAALAPDLPDSVRGASSIPYETLKGALRQKFGPESELIDALQRLERKPDSTARLDWFREEITTAKANQDAELLALAQQLLQILETKATSSQPVEAAPLPLQRPSRSEHFIGREETLAQLLNNLRPGQSIALWGPAGSGKSALVAETIWRLLPEQVPAAPFPDGLVYHNFYGQPRVDIALEKIVRAFSEDANPNPYEAAQRVLASRQALLILENVEYADDISGLLSLEGQAGVLVTSDQSHEAFTTAYPLEALSVDQAVGLLQTLAGKPWAPLPTLRGICELIGNLPLALQLVGCQLSQHKEETAAYLAWLETTILAQIEPAERQQLSPSLLLTRIFSHLSETARDALSVATLLAFAPFNEDVITKSLTIETHQGLLSSLRRVFKQKQEETVPDIGQAMTELIENGLVEKVEYGYKITHEFIHSYARQQLTLPAKAIRRIATYYIALGWEWEQGNPEVDKTVMDTNRPHFMKIMTECLEYGDWEALHGLAAAIEDYLDVQGYWAERVIVNEAGLIASWQLGRTSEGAWLSNLGDTYRTMGHARWAIEHFEKSLSTARQMNDWQGEGNSLGNLGLAYRDLGQMEQAKQYLKESLAIFEEINSPRAELVRTWLKELDQPSE